MDGNYTASHATSQHRLGTVKVHDLLASWSRLGKWWLLGSQAVLIGHLWQGPLSGSQWIVSGLVWLGATAAFMVPAGGWTGGCVAATMALRVVLHLSYLPFLPSALLLATLLDLCWLLQAWFQRFQRFHAAAPCQRPAEWIVAVALFFTGWARLNWNFIGSPLPVHSPSPELPDPTTMQQIFGGLEPWGPIVGPLEVSAAIVIPLAASWMILHQRWSRFGRLLIVVLAAFELCRGDLSITVTSSVAAVAAILLLGGAEQPSGLPSAARRPAAGPANDAEPAVGRFRLGTRAARYAALWAPVTIAVLCGLSPYLGLRTYGVFNERSRLRTEGLQPNHLLMPQLYLAPYQLELVEIEQAASRGAAQTEKTPSFGPLRTGAIIPVFEVVRIRERHRDVYFRYRRCGQLPGTSEADRSHLTAPHYPWWSQRLLAFGPVARD